MTRREALGRGRCRECAAHYMRTVGGLPLWPEGSCGGRKIDDSECTRDVEERARQEREARKQERTT